MSLKYELTERVYNDFYRIRALRDFGNVRAGELGGLVQAERNLSHFGHCWVYENARVGGEAFVDDNASVSHRAAVWGDARIYEHAIIKDSAVVQGHASVSGCAVVGGNAQVYEQAIIQEFGRVEGYAHVHGNAIIKQEMHVQYSHCTRDISLRENIIMSIKCQTGLDVMNGHVYAYKHVRRNLSSLHDPTFIYRVNEYAEATEYDSNPLNVCSSGLHVSNSHHWEGQGGKKVIMVKVALDDILSVQQGKIRCKRLFVLGVCDSETF